jgi:hypothetical protein
MAAICDSVSPTGTNSASQRAVLGVDESDSGLDDLPEHDVKLEIAADGDYGLQQGPDPVPRLDDRTQPRLQLGEQFVELHPGQQRMRLCGLSPADEDHLP